jgi:serine/threonine protein kinase
MRRQETRPKRRYNARIMSLSLGTKLGPYEIQAPLGAGGMGEVYRARDTRLERTVAIKVLPEHLSSNPDAKQRFEREARAISSLNHPHICALYDVGTQDGVDFLVMEYLEGQTLADRLQKGALPIEQTLKIGIEIADGLDKAHRQGIVHRDLKPGNIMLTKSGAKNRAPGTSIRVGYTFRGTALGYISKKRSRARPFTEVIGSFRRNHGKGSQTLSGKFRIRRTRILEVPCEHSASMDTKRPEVTQGHRAGDR